MIKIERADPDTLLKEVVDLLRRSKSHQWPLLAGMIARQLFEKHYGRDSFEYLQGDHSYLARRIARLILSRGKQLGIKSIYGSEHPIPLPPGDPYNNAKCYYVDP